MSRNRYVGKHAAKRQKGHGVVKKTVMTATAGAALAGAGVAASSGASAATSDASSILAKIKYCESTNNYQAQNPSSTASGAYQFLDTTWHGLGYSGRAKDAAPAVQDQAALKLYSQAGTSPWVSSQPCWGSMSSAPATSATTFSSTTSTKQYGQTKAYTGQSNYVAPSASTLHDEYTNFKYEGVKLTKSERALIDSYTDVQKQQSWWTPQAAAGKIVPRTVVGTSGVTIYAHSDASFTSAQVAKVNVGDKLSGHYLNTDWFAITSGEHAGQFISSASLARVQDEQNGLLDTDKQLVELPDYIRGLHNVHDKFLNPTAAKQLVKMNAAYRSEFGKNLKLGEGYRDLSSQQAYRARVGSHLTATPGDSNHGLGVAIDFWGITSGHHNLTDQWLAENSSAYGFQNPENVAIKGENWHFDFGG